MSAPPAPLRTVLPALLEAQVDLGGDLRTERLARLSHMSRSRFHAVFAEAVGETVKQYTLRLRLERAAFRLRAETTTVATIATDLGFGSHQSFTRAFRRHFGTGPKAYRRLGVGQVSKPHDEAPGVQEAADGFCLSETRAVELEATPVLFRRYVGPYEHVRPELFHELRAWADDRNLPTEGLIGIAHDAPGITPADRLRFDVCIRGAGGATGDAATGRQLLPRRWASSTWYSGPAARLGEAVAAAFRASSGLAGFAVTGLPLEEHYTSSRIVSGARIDAMRIHFRLLPTG